ncbi:MAG: helix-turn-helix transcriptional regulator [Erysipelotrichaceae bacterium]
MDRVKIGMRLMALRGTKTREEVGYFTKITCKSLESYERGYRMPVDAAKVKLARYYGVTVDSIFYQD